MVIVAAADQTAAADLVVADDGSIPAEQLTRLGIGPGTRLLVVPTPDRSGGPGLAGSMPEFPEVDWDDFERASELARHDASA
jgi:hypothetical protein